MLLKKLELEATVAECIGVGCVIIHGLLFSVSLIHSDLLC